MLRDPVSGPVAAPTPDAGPDVGAVVAGAAAPALLAALDRAAGPQALVDDHGQLQWCSQALRELLGLTDPAALLATALPRPLVAGPLQLTLPPRPADTLHPRPAQVALQLRAAGPGLWWLGPAPEGELAGLQARLADLQERLDLVQDFCDAGVFERDPVSMQGYWDAHMFRIFGLTPPTDGRTAPPYAVARALMLPEGRAPGSFRDTLQRPGVHADRLRLRRPDGAVRHIHSQWKVLHGADGLATRVIGVNIDVTAEHALAQQAQALREELALVTRLANIGVWRHDLRSDRLHLDAQASAHVGLACGPEGVTLQQVRDCVHPDDIPALQASTARTLRTGEPTDMSVRYRRPGGAWAHTLSRRTLQRDESGQPVAFLGVLLDESERVERARGEQQLTRRLETAAQAARIGLWSAVLDGRNPDWNARMFELFGLDATEPLPSMGDWLRRCVHDDDRARVAATLLPWVEQGTEALAIEFRVARPPGEAARWAVVRGAIAADTGEGLRRAEGVVIDVTEQRQALQRLREAADRVALTASAVGLGSWEQDLVTGDTNWDEAMFRLRGRNDAARHVPQPEMLGYMHPDDRGMMVDVENRRLADRQDWRLNFRVVWPDGSVRWLASRSAVLRDDSGHPLRRIGLNWDITETLQAEQTRRERELALAESHAKSRLLSRVSHELRTPLNAVLGFAQLLRDPVHGDSPTQRERWLQHVDTAGRHLLTLIDDVLELSRLDTGDLHLHTQPVDLATMVNSTLPLVQAMAQAADVELQTVPPLAGQVQADPERLREVLLNLLSNAIKYNRRGGQVQVGSQAEGQGWRLRVQDTGSGMAPERVRDAFEPFNRLDAEARGISGTGLGLSIAKALVEHMGGHIQVDSSPGQGSVFGVWLPAADTTTGGAVVPDAPAAGGSPHAERRSTAPLLPAAPTQAPAHVLYIEDNEVNALLVSELLARQPWVRLEVATSGLAGLQRARDGRPDLVLLDMQLPDMDGRDVLAALRADSSTAGLRCVALSANTLPADIEAAHAAGVVDYWTKPIVFADFLARLRQLLGRPA